MNESLPEGGEIETRLTGCPCDNPYCDGFHPDVFRLSRIVRANLVAYRDLADADRGDLVIADEAILAAARNDQMSRKRQEAGSGTQAASAEPSGERTGAQRNDQSSPRSQPVTAKEGWQPIETAPKDGTSVLVWMAEELEYPVIASWCQFIGEPPEGTYRGESYRNGWTNDHDGDYLSTEPTRWMPLPPPPGSAQPVTSASIEEARREVERLICTDLYSGSWHIGRMSAAKYAIDALITAVRQGQS